ncbi:DUF4349 domain-containing protein [Vitreoscilla massiliensis]|uniref:DUF4349 domain-containing protein n=1 Tax=Vitreoscilla massiliensis TaxID=1689272 RepID=A0ABY4DZD9_9NEIS|nr:DUF4349 domain-containing protein [Vitreoscilla massiliensis]UOO88476.1 DUF4349 domain-containing protein [Vitreoscilla massiliensis]
MKRYVAVWLCAGMLVACGKAPEQAAEHAQTMAASAPAAAELSAAPVAKSMDGVAAAAPESESEPAVATVEQNRPAAIIGQTNNPVEATRRMVREAKVDFTAKDVIAAGLEVEKLAQNAGGFIEQKDIQFESLERRVHDLGKGKLRVYEKVRPYAQMTVRVLSAQAAEFMNQLLPLMQFMNQQQYHAKRYELQLLHEKMAQVQIVPADAPVKQQNDISHLLQLEVQDRLAYSTIVITMQQNNLIREYDDVDVGAAVPVVETTFGEQALQALQWGWNGVLNVVVVLLAVWPLWVLLLVGVWTYRRVRKLCAKRRVLRNTNPANPQQPDE